MGVCTLVPIVVCFQVLHNAVLFGVTAVVYEFEGTTLEFLLSQLDTCLQGRTARCVTCIQWFINGSFPGKPVFCWEIDGKF